MTIAPELLEVIKQQVTARWAALVRSGAVAEKAAWARAKATSITDGVLDIAVTLDSPYNLYMTHLNWIEQVLNVAQGKGSLISWPFRAPEEQAAAAWNLAYKLMLARIYLWDTHIFSNAVNTLRLPTHTLAPEQFPEQVMVWYTRDEAVVISGDQRVAHIAFWVISLGFDSIDEAPVPCLDYVFRAPDGRGYIDFVSQLGTFGMRWPDEQDRFHKFYVGVARALAFLNSPFIPKEEHRLERHARRRLEQGGLHEIPTMRFVQLRRLATDHVQHDRLPGGPGHVDWSHRWLVSGHIRNQYYPSKDAHMPIWMAPYIKGPEDKPLLVKPYAVVR